MMIKVEKVIYNSCLIFLGSLLTWLTASFFLGAFLPFVDNIVAYF